MLCICTNRVIGFATSAWGGAITLTAWSVRLSEMGTTLWQIIAFSARQHCSRTARRRQSTVFTIGAHTSPGKSPDPAKQTRTLHFLNLHLWHALTTLLLTSTVPRDTSDFGERGILCEEAIVWACEESKNGFKCWQASVTSEWSIEVLGDWTGPYHAGSCC